MTRATRESEWDRKNNNLVSDVCHVECMSTSALNLSFPHKSKALATSIDAICAGVLFIRFEGLKMFYRASWILIFVNGLKLFGRKRRKCSSEFFCSISFSKPTSAHGQILSMLKSRRRKERKTNEEEEKSLFFGTFFFCFYQQNWQVGVIETASNHQHVSLGMFQFWFCKSRMLSFDNDRFCVLSFI